MTRILVLIVLTVLVGGCATAGLTLQERYDKNDREVLVREEYQRDASSCERAGGVMQLRRWRATRIPHKLTIFEMKTAECVNPQSVIDDLHRQGYY